VDLSDDFADSADSVQVLLVVVVVLEFVFAFAEVASLDETDFVGLKVQKFEPGSGPG
jgi:hypothetical protein